MDDALETYSVGYKFATNYLVEDDPIRIMIEDAYKNFNESYKKSKDE